MDEDACRIEILRDGLQCVPAAAHENDIGAFRRETPGGRRTDARTCAGDKDGFARKTLHDLGLSKLKNSLRKCGRKACEPVVPAKNGLQGRLVHYLYLTKTSGIVVLATVRFWLPN